MESGDSMRKRPIRETLSKAALDVIGVPSHLQSVTIDKFDTKGNESLSDVKEYMREYLENLDKNFDENKGLFLYGSNGVGKTFLGSLVVKEAYRHRYSTKRVYFQTYVDDYTRVWNAKSVDEREELESNLYTEYTGVEFLCIEEIGKEIDMKITAPVLEHLLRYREDHKLPTIVCTNLDIADIQERYGISVASLIKGNMTPILIEGKDKRSSYYSKRTQK